jgi:hypothetical protein
MSATIQSDPFMPNIPAKNPDNLRTEAVRVAAHKEGVNNDLNSINNKGKMGSVGTLGIRGDQSGK